MLPLHTTCKQSISAKFLWSFRSCEGLARCWELSLAINIPRSCYVSVSPLCSRFAPQLCSHSFRGGCSWGELFPLGFAVVQERFVPPGAGRHGQAPSGHWDREGKTSKNRRGALAATAQLLCPQHPPGQS